MFAELVNAGCEASIDRLYRVISPRETMSFPQTRGLGLGGGGYKDLSLEKPLINQMSVVGRREPGIG